VKRRRERETGRRGNNAVMGRDQLRTRRKKKETDDIKKNVPSKDYSKKKKRGRSGESRPPNQKHRRKGSPRMGRAKF